MTINFKKLIISIIAGGFGMWVIAGVWHNLIMANLYEHVHAAHDGLGLLLVAYLILAAFMAYLYPLLHKKKRPVIEGLKFGVIIGLLWVFPHGLAMAGAHDSSVVYVIKNSLWHTVEQGIGGIIIALVYGNNQFSFPGSK